MRIKKIRQLLKSFADDTRLRIINLLMKEPLNVSDLHSILGSTQSNISKHLARLRLTGIVADRRSGSSVYYRIAEFDNKSYTDFVHGIITKLTELEILKRDLERLKLIKKKKGIIRKG